MYTRVIEEYARHSGHADLLRQRIDGGDRLARAALAGWLSGCPQADEAILVAAPAM